MMFTFGGGPNEYCTISAITEMHQINTTNRKNDFFTAGSVKTIKCAKMEIPRLPDELYIAILVLAKAKHLIIRKVCHYFQRMVIKCLPVLKYYSEPQYKYVKYRYLADIYKCFVKWNRLDLLKDFVKNPRFHKLTRAIFWSAEHPFTYAINTQCPEIAYWLLENIGINHSCMNHCLCLSASYGFADLVEALLKKGANPDANYLEPILITKTITKGKDVRCLLTDHLDGYPHSKNVTIFRQFQTRTEM
jgi:hypothetical protein